MRGLGVTREPGWIGGVSVGVATRLGIDPLIVRGIVVVLAILGGPALLLYAAAWALLPDQTGRIHAEELFHGVFDKAIAGIGVMLLLALLPLGGANWWMFSDIDGGWFAGPSLGGLVWSLIVIGAIVWFVIWLANRSGTSGTPTADARNAASSYPAAPASAATFAAQGTAAADTIGAPMTPPEEPPAPAADAPDEELAAWKQRQADWKREHEAWRQQQAASERERQQRQRAEQRRINQEEAAERARRHREEDLRTRPGSVYSLIAVGLALIASAVVALLLADVDWDISSKVVIALSAALAVLGLAVLVNGFRGKRSGGAGGVAVVVVAALLIAGASGWVRGPIISDRTIIWSPALGQDSDRTVVSGDVVLDLDDYFDGASARAHGSIDLFVVSGDVDVVMPADASGTADIGVLSGRLTVDGERVYDGAFADETIEFEARGDNTGRSIDVEIYVISGNIAVTQAR